MDSEIETVDVIICGCGPTGAMLSAQLARLSVSNIVLEHAENITNDPRGIALDEDGIRALQSVGLYDYIHTEIGQCMGRFKFVPGRHSDLRRRPFLEFDYATSEGGTGHVGFICHKQPLLEQHLRNVTRDHSCSQLRTQSTVTLIREDDQWVYATYKDRESTERTIRSKYLVGTDGKTGFTRKQYLESKGVTMDRITSTPYDETWVAINWKLTLPTPDSHPDFPAWKMGHTPEQVYEAFFPADFRFLCNPSRPAVCGRFGLRQDRMWRFEFVVWPAEDGTDMASEESLERIVRPYFTRPGSEYGVPYDVSFPKDCIETLRARPFRFSARSCNVWALGRTMLCGDSAHVFPPFGGQGIASGFRDACALAWRLKIATQPGFQHRDSFFSAWYRERKQQLDRSLAATVENGSHVTEGNPVKALLRNIYFFLVQLVPLWKRSLEQGARRDGMTQYTFEDGMHFLPEFEGGKLFPQVYCAVPDEFGTWGRIQFTDDVIFSPEKSGVFQIVALAGTPQDGERAKQEVLSIEKPSSRFVVLSETTVIVRYATDNTVAFTKASSANSDKIEFAMQPTIVRLATAAEFAASPLCTNRPPPRYHDDARLYNEVNKKRFVILRPDKFVFATCTDAGQLHRALGRLDEIFDLTPGNTA